MVGLLTVIGVAYAIGLPCSSLFRRGCAVQGLESTLPLALNVHVQVKRQVERVQNK